MAILTGIYVLVGGYMATAVNDFIQGLIMLVGICAVVASVLSGNGGFSAAVESLSHIPSETAPGLSGAFVSFLGPQPIYLLGVVLLTSLGTWGLPQMVGKFYAIRNEAAIRKGTIISTFFAIIVAGGCYFLGGFGRLYGQNIEYTAAGTPVYDSIVPSMLATLPDLMIGVVIILVLSASMSTLSSLVLTSGSTLTLDIIDPALARARKGVHMNDRRQLLCIRLLVLFFIIVSSVLAIVQAKSSVTFIAQLMGISWGALAGAFLAPFLYGLYWKRTTAASVWASFITGVAVMCGCMYFHQPLFHLADQCRHAGHAAGPGRSAGGESLHQSREETGSGRDVRLLRKHRHRPCHRRPLGRVGSGCLENEIVTGTQNVAGGRQAAFVI